MAYTKKIELLGAAMLVFAGLLAACSDDSSDSDPAALGAGGSGEDYYGADEAYGGASDGDVDGDTDSNAISPSAGQLTAGEWRDLDNWSYWLSLFEGGDAGWADMESYWRFYTDNRLTVTVLDGDAPAVDVPVEVWPEDAGNGPLYAARTDNLGRAELFPGLFSPNGFSGPVTVRAGDNGESIRLDEWNPAEPITVQLAATTPPKVLDIMFVVDTTGSMGDEISYLKSELRDVIDRVQEKNGQQLTIRMSVNFYRDDGDAYVVRSFPFTTDIATAQEQLSGQSADGGGDFEEAVERALEDAVYEHSWSDRARARLLFLVLDAPPHHTDAILTSLENATTDAAAMGIRIIPVSASGIDKQTEFLLRFLDIATGGTYTFITNHSGIGGDHIEPTIGQYEVEYLNDLLVRVTNEYLQ